MEAPVVIAHSSETPDIAGYDPFDEPLEKQFREDEELILDDIYFEEARNSVTLDGILFSGVQKLYDDLYDDSKLPRTCSIVSRMDEFKMTDMRRQDAGAYLAKVAASENFRLSYTAQQALIATALNETVGGINAFITILGRCITMARATYFTSEGRTLPDKAKCLRPAVPDGKAFPGAELIITLPATPEPILIDEYLVSRMQSEYKTHFPILKKKKLSKSEPSDQVSESILK